MNELSNNEIINLKSLSKKDIWDKIGDKPGFLFDGIVKWMKERPKEGQKLIDECPKIILKLDEIQRIKFITAWKLSVGVGRIGLNFSNQNIKEVIDEIDSHFDFILKITEENLKDYKFHATSFYKTLFKKRKRNIVFRRLQPNMTIQQIMDIYNWLANNKFIEGTSVTSCWDKHNKTYLKFRRLFINDGTLDDWISDKIKWLVTSSKNSSFNKKSLLDLFLLMRDKKLIQIGTPDMDIFKILETNFCDSSGNSISPFTHSNKGSNNVTSEHHEKFIELIQAIK